MRFDAREAESWRLERLQRELQTRKQKLEQRNYQLRESNASRETALRDLIESGTFNPEEDEIDDFDEPHRSEIKALLANVPPAGLLESIATLKREVSTLKTIIARKAG
jgi:hypothetical protein